MFWMGPLACLIPIIKEAKQLLMGADLSHLLSVDKIKHKWSIYEEWGFNKK